MSKATDISGYCQIQCEKCGEELFVCNSETYNFFSQFKDRDFIEVSDEMSLFASDVEKHYSKNFSKFLYDIYCSNYRLFEDIRKEGKLHREKLPTEKYFGCASFSDFRAEKIKEVSSSLHNSPRFLYRISYKVSPSPVGGFDSKYPPMEETENMVCPCCKAKLSMDNTVFFKNRRDKEQADKEKNEIITSIETSIIANDYKVPDTIDVLEYLKNLTNIKTSIRYYTELLAIYVADNIKCKRDDYRIQAQSEGIVRAQIDEELKQIQDQLDDYQEKMIPSENEIGIGLDRAGVIKPIAPIKPIEPNPFNGEIPEKPEMIKPGLFNRAKVNKENEQAMAQYEEKLNKYNEELAKYTSVKEQYQQSMEKYNAEKAEYDEKNKLYEDEKKRIRSEIAEQKSNTYREQIDDLTRKRNEANAKIRDIANESRILADNSMEHQLSVMYDKEIEEVKQTLKDLMQCEADLLSFDVVYPKYLDYIALLTMYEYFETGRVTELKGPNGAYNLYESELRQNIIISKMDVVIKQLEDIKNNQYMLYHELNSIKTSIDKVADVLGKISSSVEDINSNVRGMAGTLDKIENNTAVTAFYAEKTAQYTKRQNDLTKALGYLVLFK